MSSLISARKVEQIRALKAKGFTNNHIAEELDTTWNTVAKYTQGTPNGETKAVASTPTKSERERRPNFCPECGYNLKRFA